MISKVATIQDLSGFGRCSLTVAIPILSAMGIQVCPIPTAILSTHTGGFEEPVFHDLTCMIDDVIHHWKRIDLKFEALYSGFLGNEEQIDQVKSLFEAFKEEGTFTLVDPVMGDEGVLYSTYNEVMQKQMKELVRIADIVTPNMTELYFLLDEPYSEALLSKEQAFSYVKRMSEMGPLKVVLKGVALDDGQKVNITYDRPSNTYHLMPYDEVPMHYPGTGDTFASVLVGELVKGESLESSVQKAADFVREAVLLTKEEGTAPRDGIIFEPLLGMLIEKRS